MPSDAAAAAEAAPPAGPVSAMFRDVEPSAEATPAAPGSEPAGGEPAPPAAETSWLDALPEELRNSVRDFQSPEALAKSYLSLRRSGKGGIPLPDPDKPLHQYEHWKELGAVDTPEAVELKRPDAFPEDQWNAEWADEFSKFVVDQKMPRHLAQAAVDWIAAMEMSAAEARQAAADAAAVAEGEALEAAMAEAGWVGQKRQAELQHAQTGRRAYGLDDAAIEQLAGSVGGFTLMQILAEVGRGRAEASITGAGGGFMTKQEQYKALEAKGPQNFTAADRERFEKLALEIAAGG